MIKELTLVLVKTGHGLHVVIGQFKVEDIDVLGHPLLVNGLWNDRDAPLQEPTQDDPTIGLAVLGCNLGNRFVGEDVVLTFGEWCPGFNPDAFTLRKLNFLVLLVPRVNFDLVNSGLNGFRQFQVLQLVSVEVGNPDGTDLTGLLGFLQGPPSTGAGGRGRCSPDRAFAGKHRSPSWPGRS